MQIIDSLFVEFGLDPTKFTAGQKKIIDDLDKLKDKSGKIGGEVSKGAEVMEQGFAALQRRLLAIVGLFVGGMGIGRFTEDVTRLTSASGRLTQQLNLNLRDFGAWERIGEGVGAASGEMGKGLASLQQQLAHARQFGGGPLYEFSQATTRQGQGPPVYLYNRRGEQRDPTDILLDMSRWWQAQKDKAGATNLLQQLGGVSPGMMNAIMLGPEELKKRLEQYRKYAPTSEQVEQFQKLQKAMADASISAETLGRLIAAMISPALIDALKTFSDIVTGIVDAINGFKNEPPGTKHEPTSSGDLWDRATHPYGRLRSWWKDNAPTWLGGRSPDAAPELNAPHPNSPVFKDYKSEAPTGSLRDRIGRGKRAMMDQLRKEGVPESNLEEAANLLAGQALAESSMNPRTVHDQGTGYGIYGARLDRRAKMIAWMKANGYPPSSLEGQSAYMAHEAMSGDYPRTRSALMGADARSRAINQRTLTAEFERPAYINNRLGHTNQAAAVAATGGLWERGGKAFEAFDLGNIPGADLIAGSRNGMFGPAPAGSTTNSTSIGDINVYSQATDGKGVARDLHADLARQGNVVIHSDTGLE